MKNACSMCRESRPPAVSPNLDYDAELQRYNEPLRRACRIGRADRVLDVGCGAGQTTRDAGRAAAAGVAIGVDISAAVIQEARRLARAEGLHNVRFIHADAEVHPFPPETIDVAISRFGTMFFHDAVRGFTNIARALRVGGRLVLIVWQARERNEWEMSIQNALARDEHESDQAPDGPDPFSLSNADSLRHIIEVAGFVEPSLADVDEPVFYGRTIGEAVEWVQRFASTRATLERLDGQARSAALDRLRSAMAAHHRTDGVWLDSRAWIVTARRK
jgi:SAM-dependent methyltransferase